MKNYLIWLFAITVSSAVLATAFVCVIDPYGVYGWVHVPGFNEIKPRPNRYQSEIKLAAAARQKADALILGNSRADIGLDPKHAGFRLHGLNAYNLAVPGTSDVSSVSQLKYLLRSAQHPAMVIMGLDFLDFPTRPDGDQAELAGMERNSIEDWDWKLETLFSLTSVYDAWRTLRIQSDPYAETLGPHGLNPLLEYKKMAHAQGYYAFFAQRAQENAKVFSKKPHTLFNATTHSSSDIEALRLLYRTAAENNIELYVLIYPYHAQIMAMFERFGLWPMFEKWKALVTSEAERVQIAYPDAKIQVWDFSGFSGPRCEVIPKRGDRLSETRWYWEAGHFKAALGDLILDQILSEPGRGFGHRLSTTTLAENEARIAKERAQCLSDYPALFAEVSKMRF